MSLFLTQIAHVFRTVDMVMLNSIKRDGYKDKFLKAYHQNFRCLQL